MGLDTRLQRYRDNKLKFVVKTNFLCVENALNDDV